MLNFKQKKNINKSALKILFKIHLSNSYLTKGNVTAGNVTFKLL